MTIEFNCPYCKSLIRVPDSARGGKGKCPKCSTRLTVPKSSTVKPIELPLAGKPVQVERPVEQPRDDQPREIENFFDPHYDPRKPDSSLPAETVPAPQSLPGEFPDEFSEELPRESPDLSSTPAIRKKVSLLKKLGRGLWMIPVGVGLVLCAGFGWYVWQEYQSERLGGELTAEAADELELPPLLIEKWSIQQPPDEVQTLLSELEKSPVPLLSSLMQVQLRGSSRGILVHLDKGESARFYRVEVGGNPPLTKFIAKHAADFEQQRVKEVERAATQFAIEYRKVIAKKAEQSSLTGFRNSMALPALVRGMGHQVVATHGRTIYPCVYEDREGGLYFLLPPDAKAFEISGRKHADGSVPFPAIYKVTVTGLMKVPAKTGEGSTDKSKTKKSKGKPGPVFKRSDEAEEKMDPEDDAAMKKKNE